jgi:hypothetical protein
MLAIVKMVQLAPQLSPLEALLAPDGKNGAAIRSLCGILSIDLSSQLHRIKRLPDLAAALHYVTIDTPGGPQEVVMLESWAIAVWLAGLHTSRLSPASQEVALLLKQHAYSAIARAFAEPEEAPAIPMTRPVPAEIASPRALGRIRDGFSEALKGFSELQEDLADVQQRLTLLEEADSSAPAASGAALSSHQVGQVFLRLRLLRERKGIFIEQSEQQLAAAFHVAHVTDIDAADWQKLTQAILALF